MYIVLGATGHVGSAVATALIDAGEEVVLVSRDAAKAAIWESRGAETAILDVMDTDALHDLLARGKRAFLLNPPADPSTDTDAEERRTFASIAAAVAGTRLEKIVVESTYGAQAGENCGDLNILFDFEEELRRQPIPTVALRAAYYMSNWDGLLESAKQGVLPTMYPADLVIPMVAPADLGAAAARLLRAPPDRSAIHYVEGPRRYSSADVAAAFAEALGISVEVKVTPREAWIGAFRKLGFSESAAKSYARMTAVSVDGAYEMPANPERGTITLRAYIANLVAR